MQSEFHIRSQRKYQMLDITRQVQEIVRAANLPEAICSVYVTHATAAVVINENDDPNVCEDVLAALDKLIPEGIWRHDRVDNNAQAHIKAALLGPSETVPVENGDLLLGRWQGIMLVEFDGPRARRLVSVRIVPESCA